MKHCFEPNVSTEDGILSIRNLVCLLMCGLLLFAYPVWAQVSSLIPYSWESGNLALAYPSSWDAPVEQEQDGRLVLQLAQTMTASPETRPPGIPFISLTLIADVPPDADATPFLGDALQAIGVTPASAASAALLGTNAIAGGGMSDDGVFFGLSRAAILPDGTLLIVSGRAPAAQQESFTRLFDAVADSIVPGASSQPLRPTYGVLWNTTSNAGESQDAFVNLVGAALDVENRLYTADALAGVIQLDAETGAVLNRFPDERLTTPSALAVGVDGTVYVGDLACQCILTLDPNGQWNANVIDGFGPGAPTSLVITDSGILYATDQTENGFAVRVFQSGDERLIRLDEVSGQPRLVIDRSGRVLALADGAVMAVDDDKLRTLATLGTASLLIDDAAVDPNNHFVLATDDQGIIIMDSGGQLLDTLGRIVANYPLPGELVNPNGVAVGADGTIYIVDSDGTFGSITAMSTRVQAGRIGATMLTPGSAVQGSLNAETTQQEWTLNGVAGERVTLSAVDSSRLGLLDVALRLIDPDGNEEAFNDNQETGMLFSPFDAQIANHELRASGVYTVQAERVDGEGIYSLGVSQAQTFELDTDGVTEVRGALTDALPVQQWRFEGKAGQSITLTLQAESGTLDPLVRLLDASGAVLEENDDAADTALGRSAQIVQVRLPADGAYTIEALRFDGEGDYRLIIVATSS